MEVLCLSRDAYTSIMTRDGVSFVPADAQGILDLIDEKLEEGLFEQRRAKLLHKSLQVSEISACVGIQCMRTSLWRRLLVLWCLSFSR